MDILKATLLADKLLASEGGKMPEHSWRMQEESRMTEWLIENFIQPFLDSGRHPLDVLALAEKAMLSYLLRRPGVNLATVAASLEMSDTKELIALAARYGFRPQVG